MIKFFKQIQDFFLCLLKDNCKYSIKKVLCFLFSFVSIYIIIFTDKDYYEILGFIALLLGIRSYERLKQNKPVENSDASVI
jgi:hypothetical protein